jgi:hypothetical protein
MLIFQQLNTQIHRVVATPSSTAYDDWVISKPRETLRELKRYVWPDSPLPRTYAFPALRRTWTIWPGVSN